MNAKTTKTKTATNAPAPAPAAPSRPITKQETLDAIVAACNALLAEPMQRADRDGKTPNLNDPSELYEWIKWRGQNVGTRHGRDRVLRTIVADVAERSDWEASAMLDGIVKHCRHHAANATERLMGSGRSRFESTNPFSNLLEADMEHAVWTTCNAIVRAIENFGEGTVGQTSTAEEVRERLAAMASHYINRTF